MGKPTPEEMGRTSYDAYAFVVGGVSVHGEQLPAWEQLTGAVQNGWMAAAYAGGAAYAAGVQVPVLVHVAGIPQRMVQACTRCGAVLIDITAWAEGRVAVLAGDGRDPSWWPAGAQVAKGGVVTYSVDRAVLTDDEKPCRP